MGITFTKNPKTVAAQKAAETVAEAVPEVKAKTPAASKSKLKGAVAASNVKTAVAEATIESFKQNNQTGEVTDYEASSELVETPLAAEPAASAQMPVVSFSAGSTNNLGEFNSFKVQVTLSLPVTPTEIDEGYDFVKDWVSTRLNAAVAEVIS